MEDRDLFWRESSLRDRASAASTRTRDRGEDWTFAVTIGNSADMDSILAAVLYH